MFRNLISHSVEVSSPIEELDVRSCIGAKPRFNQRTDWTAHIQGLWHVKSLVNRQINPP